MTISSLASVAAFRRREKMRNSGELEAERRGVSALIVETDEINERLWRIASTLTSKREQLRGRQRIDDALWLARQCNRHLAVIETLLRKALEKKEEVVVDGQAQSVQ